MTSDTTRNTLAAAVLFALGAPMAGATDLYYQPFNISPAPNTCDISLFPGPGSYPFPADWLLFNVDGRTPASNVSYVNNAWIVREDFSFNVAECAAFSTSWYSPAGSADDWMWSPAVAIPAGGAGLGWRAVAYDPSYRDGYEVRVKTGAAPTPANQTASDVVFTTPAEASAWTQHSLDLSTYAGQSVYVGFRNNSNDKFLLLVDDVRVFSSAPDLAATAPTPPYASEYARAPLGMDIVPSLAVNASNVGGSQLTNITAIAVPTLDGSAAGAALPSAAPIASLATGATAPVTFGAPAAYSGAGTWTTTYTLFSDQTASDANPANDSIEIPGTTIGGSEFARWEGPATGTLGIGAGDGGELGVQLTIPADGWYAGAHFGISAIPPEEGAPPAPNVCPGFDYVVNLRAYDTVNDVPGAVIASTEPVACEFDTAYSVDGPFAGGAVFLAAGTYVLTAVEPSPNGPTLRLMLHDNRFVTGTTWVDWPSSPFNGWAHFEDFGVQFGKTPELSLLAGEAPELPIFVDGFDGVVPRPAGLRRVDHVPSPLSLRPLRKPAPTRFAVPSDR